MKKVVSVILALVMVLALGAVAFADTGITVTKNPTTENRLAGETAYFDSAAQSYRTLEWTFVDPQGHEYSAKEFITMFPFVTLKDENTANLKICNVSTILNGWSVYCTFRSNDASAKTAPAFLYVSPVQYTAPNSTSKNSNAPVYTYVTDYYYGYVEPVYYAVDGYDPSAFGYVEEYLYDVDGYDPYAAGYVEEYLYESDGFDPYASGYVEEDLYDADGFDPSVYGTDNDSFDYEYFDDDFAFIDFD